MDPRNTDSAYHAMPDDDPANVDFEIDESAKEDSEVDPAEVDHEPPEDDDEDEDD